MTQQALKLDESPWFEVRDGDGRLREFYDRHYSSRGGDAAQIVGPGGKLVLLTHDLGALFAWRLFRDACPLAPKGAINCAVFRRERGELASLLIEAAEPFAFARWGRRPLYTYVDPGSITSANAGYCFKRAGYRAAGLTRGGHGRPRLVVLVKR